MSKTMSTYNSDISDVEVKDEIIYCKPGRGLTGLSNLGNTCFMNATLQCLSHTYELNKYLCDDTYKKRLNEVPESALLIEWENLRKILWSENCIVSPGGFLANVHKVAKIKDKDIFTGFAQNDLPEFFLFLIDGFHCALQRPVQMTIKGVAEDPEDKLALKCYNMMKNMYEKEHSEILKLFYGIHVSEIKSVEEEGVLSKSLSQTPEPFLMLNLPIPPHSVKRTPTLYDCIDLYTETESLTDWKNTETGEEQEVTRSIKFFSLPEVLVIDLKRFNNQMRKDQRIIEFPIENLDLSDYVIGYHADTYVYDLYGICNHSGSTYGGHYTAFVKNADDNWYHYNDRSVTEITSPISKIITSKAYCLFYRKKNSST